MQKWQYTRRQLMHMVWQLECQCVLQIRNYLIYERKTNHFWPTTIYKKEKTNSIHIPRALIMMWWMVAYRYIIITRMLKS